MWALELWGCMPLDHTSLVARARSRYVRRGTSPCMFFSSVVLNGAKLCAHARVRWSICDVTSISDSDTSTQIQARLIAQC